MKRLLIFSFLLFTFSLASFAQLETYNFPSSYPNIISEEYVVRGRILEKNGNHGNWEELAVLNVVPRSPYVHPICGEQASIWNITGEWRQYCMRYRNIC